MISLSTPRRPSASPRLLLALLVTVLAPFRGTAVETLAPPPVFNGPFAAGQLEAPPRHEASGLAISRRSPDLLWTHDDSGGEPVLYAIDTSGRKRGALRISGVKNEDWEDMASFERDGRAWLLIADVGDNVAKRTHLRLHLVAEPDPKLLQPDAELTATPEYSIRFQFEDGARDCESVAVDAVEGAIYLLSKRDTPPRLYRLPLARPTVKTELAKYLGTATHLAGQSGMDALIKQVVGKKFSWPTAMDISADGRMAAVLTYGEPLVYLREGNEPWVETFKREPMRLLFSGLPQAEAICFSRDGRTIYVASEGVTALVRYTREQ